MDEMTVCVIVIMASSSLLLAVVLSGRKNRLGWASVGDFRNRRQGMKERQLRAFYRTVQKIPFLGQYAKKVSAAFRALCPYDDYSLYRMSAVTIAWVAAISVPAVLFILAFNVYVDGHVTVYAIGCSLFAVHIVSAETLNIRLNAVDRKMMDDFIIYLSAVKHSYEECSNIPRAIAEASEELCHEMRMHILKMSDILTEADRADKVRNYVLSDEIGKYFKMFMIQAYEASERGNVRNEQGFSVFSHNMEFLRIDIMRDRVEKERQAFRLQGYTMAVALPVFCMSILRKWGLDFSAEMASFYETAGKFIEAATYFASVFLYGIVNRTREASTVGVMVPKFLERATASGRGRELVLRLEGNSSGFAARLRALLASAGMNPSFGLFFLRMAGYASCMFLAAVLMFSLLHAREREHLMTEIDNIDTIIAIGSQRQKDAVAAAIAEVSQECRSMEKLSVAYVRQAFLGKVYLTNRSVIDASVNEIIRRIEEYKGSYFKWYELLLSVVAGVAVAFIPMIEIVYQKSVLQKQKDGEVRLFQALVLMEREFPTVTVLSLLEEMETFSSVFRKSIRECINNCPSGQIEALKKLKEKEKGFSRFAELIDGFLAADKVGIRRAFDELENSREMYERANELESERSLEKKRDFIELLSYIPSALVVGAYFIIPFCANVLNGVSDVFTSIEYLQSSGL